MDVETWQIFVALAILVIAYGLVVGVIGVSPPAFVAFVLAVTVGAFVGWRIST